MERPGKWCHTSREYSEGAIRRTFAHAWPCRAIPDGFWAAAKYSGSAGTRGSCGGASTAAVDRIWLRTTAQNHSDFLLAIARRKTQMGMRVARWNESLRHAQRS